MTATGRLRAGDPRAIARERRERYCELRRQGLLKADAAREAGVSLNMSTLTRYERWFQAAERGEETIPGHLGRPRKGEKEIR